MGVVAMAILSKLVFKRDPCCEVGHEHRGLGFMSLLAMSVCSVNDGLLIGLLDPVWFSGLNLGMVLHKITSSFAIAQVLRRSRFSNVGLAVFGIAYILISPVALLVVQGNWIKNLPDSEIILGFSAGLLTYVTLVNLLPQARLILQRRPRASYGFAAAFLISIGLGFWHSALHERLESSESGSTTPSLPSLPTGPSSLEGP
jgi:zinc transporter ZupT